MVVLKAKLEDLSPAARQAVTVASDITVEECFEAIEATSRSGEGFDETVLEAFLPPACRSAYTKPFLRGFLVSLVTVGWKLAQPESYWLTCKAEEVALKVIVERGKTVLEADRALAAADPDELDGFEERAVEDRDYAFLWHPEFDGIDSSELGAEMGMESLAPARWFDRYNPPSEVIAGR